MGENRENLLAGKLSEKDIELQSSYILNFLGKQLTDIKIKRGSRIFNSNVLFEFLNPSFIEKSDNMEFLIDQRKYLVERGEYHDFLEVSFTRFNSLDSQTVSEGFRVRVKRPGAEKESFVEYHKMEKDKKPLNIINTKMAVTNAIDFISSIS